MVSHAEANHLLAADGTDGAQDMPAPQLPQTPTAASSAPSRGSLLVQGRNISAAQTASEAF